MAKINSRAKGANGEREFCKWLAKNFNVELPERNLEQVRHGGADIIDIEPFFFEVKRVENIDLYSWWNQVRLSVKSSPFEKIPVVAFRQNRSPWEFLISAECIGSKRGFVRLQENVFIKWAEKII